MRPERLASLRRSSWSPCRAGGMCLSGAVGWTRACSRCCWRSGEAGLRWGLAAHACVGAHLRVPGERRGQGLQLQAARSPTPALQPGWPVTAPASFVPGTPKCTPALQGGIFLPLNPCFVSARWVGVVAQRGLRCCHWALVTAVGQSLLTVPQGAAGRAVSPLRWLSADPCSAQGLCSSSLVEDALPHGVSP